MSGNIPVIRRRATTTRRRRDGLIQFARDNTSQNGEDGILAKLFELLPACRQRVCVDVGAWDGRHLSNTYSLLIPNSSSSSSSSSWRGILIEADRERFQELEALHQPLGNQCLNVTVSCLEGSDEGLVALLQRHATDIPKDFDLLCIDVDGSDYWLLHDVWSVGKYAPQVVCVEFNPTMPNDLVYIPARSDAVRHGASLAALVELAEGHGYVLVETTLYNAFFVPHNLYQFHLQQIVPDTTIESLHEITMGTSLYQLYDGTLKLWGCKKLLWHRIPIEEKKIQMLSEDQRQFPFAPPTDDPEKDDLHKLAVDMSPFCRLESNENEQLECAKTLIHQLQKDGFCLIRGTGISRQVCESALHWTNAFLQGADESVRRSCLAKDRARRGYSPMCTENFASLIGAHGPNDLVRKFRIGPNVLSGKDYNALLNPNIWPTTEVWEEDSCHAFRSTLEEFYDRSCLAAHLVVRAICKGLVTKMPSLETSMSVLAMNDSLAHTSILTLLGYRKGARHKLSQKKHVHPLVAAHTDVGVITMLLFDGGDCAVLQRREIASDKDSWIDVKLPPKVPNDPIFVVNIADCLSDLSQGFLPSTLHRVIPSPGNNLRNCLALFVGLDPKQKLIVNDEPISYEEWRKRRIAAAQSVLKSTGTEKGKKDCDTDQACTR